MGTILPLAVGRFHVCWFGDQVCGVVRHVTIGSVQRDALVVITVEMRGVFRGVGTQELALCSRG